MQYALYECTSKRCRKRRKSTAADLRQESGLGCGTQPHKRGAVVAAAPLLVILLKPAHHLRRSAAGQESFLLARKPVSPAIFGVPACAVAI